MNDISTGWHVGLTDPRSILDKLSNKGLPGRVHSLGPEGERESRPSQWVRLRCDSRLPNAHELVEVRLASGLVQRGHARDFLWTMPRGCAGRITQFRRAR